MTANLALVITLDDRRRPTDDTDPCCLSCAILGIAARLDGADGLLIPTDVVVSAAAELRAEVDRAQRRAEQIARARTQRDQETTP